MPSVRATTARVEIWGQVTDCKVASTTIGTNGIVIDDEGGFTPAPACTAWRATFHAASAAHDHAAPTGAPWRIEIPQSLGAAAERRLRTFIAGRYCAERALRAAGLHGSGLRLVRRPSGAPHWPAGCTGSIAHTDRVAIAVVAPSAHVRSVGVDIEAVLSAEAVTAVASHALPELSRLRQSRGVGTSRALLATVGFSVKESLYKCLHPIVGRFFDFTDAEVTDVDIANGSARIRLLSSLNGEFPAGREFRASLTVMDDLVTTLVALPADSVAPLAADPHNEGWTK